MRVAIFGAGFFSHFHYDSWTRIPGVELVGICVRSSRTRAEECAARYGARAVYTDAARMLDETRPDLVDIITTPESHATLAALAMERRIPTICQKPLAPSLAVAEAMVAAARAHHTMLVAHENWRFRPWHREAARLVRAGAVGELYNVSFRMRPGDGQGPRAYLDRQPYFQAMPRFLIHETGIHMIDVFRFIAGDIAGVGARLRQLNPAIAGEDAGLVTFDFASGAAGLLDGNRLADFDAENTRLTMGELMIEGSEGSLRIDGRARLWLRRRGSREAEHAYRWENRGYAGDSVHALQVHVVAHLREGAPIENTGEEYLRAVRVEDAVYRSHAERRWIALNP